MPALSMDKRCEQSDLPEAMCAHCRNDRLDPLLEDGAFLEPAPTRLVSSGRLYATHWTKAEFDSKRCPGGCDQPIFKGEQIGLVEGQWVCQSCAEGRVS